MIDYKFMRRSTDHKTTRRKKLIADEQTTMTTQDQIDQGGVLGLIEII